MPHSPHRPHASPRYALIAVSVWLMLALFLAVRAEEPDREDKIKAAVLVKIIKFVEWPETTGLPASAALNLCWLGNTGIGQALSNAGPLSVQGHPIMLRELTGGTGRLAGCHVLFVPTGAALSDGVRREALAQSTLTIGEANDFACRGGMIGLVEANNRLGFEVNLEVARKAGIRLAAPLLELSRIVETAECDR